MERWIGYQIEFAGTFVISEFIIYFNLNILAFGPRDLESIIMVQLSVSVLNCLLAFAEFVIRLRMSIVRETYKFNFWELLNIALKMNAG